MKKNTQPSFANSALDLLERIGNRLPDPAALFVIGLLVIAFISHLAVLLDWVVTNISTSKIISANSLLNAEGVWWLLSHLVDNFMQFPPLGIVLVGMLGIGVADRSGLLPTVLKMASMRVKGMWLSPAIIFLGIMSSIALDAGYVVLPPVAAMLFVLANRSPIAGIAAAFAGVSAGFGANLFITSLDPMLAGLTQSGASLLDQNYRVAVTSNWWFMIASTFMLTVIGWVVTEKFVEPRFNKNSAVKIPDHSMQFAEVSAKQKTAVRFAILSMLVLLAIIVLSTLVPGTALFGQGQNFPRWVEVTVPLLFIIFLVPGIIYGMFAGTIKSHHDIAKLMIDTLSSMAPYIVLAFFAAQFIEAFKYTNLGEMLAIGGGQWLASAGYSVYLLIFIFVLIVMFGNLLIGSMSAKYAFFAPVFVPLFMQLGVRPELTQIAYRIGDSITNVITPLNPYLIIILSLLKEYYPKSGIGTLISIMLPYAIAFAIAWILLLFAWMLLEIPLGPNGLLFY